MTERTQIVDLANQLVTEGADSVFLYGSRARGDNQDMSDWEVGAVYERGRKVSRSELAKKALAATVIYPFVREDLEAGIVMVPFTQSVWLTELILTGKTLAGARVIANLALPEITREDLLEDTSFSKARALDAMLALRGGFYDLGKDLLVKSCLLGVRDLMLLSGMDFPLSYDEIVEKGQNLLPEEYAPVLAEIGSIRHGHGEVTLDMAFDNLGIFSDVIEPKLREE